ncbi:MAG TPA: BON domain-containing protein [Ktedonobacterales bacterium]|nr:BON domain-containing protein [Ktedonobacterales bacterium]
MESQSLAARIQQQLEKQADIHVLVAQERNVILLSGWVGTEEERGVAEQIAASLAPDARIANNLDVESFLPVGSEGERTFIPDAAEGDEIPTSASIFAQEGLEFEPGVNNQPLETNEINVVDTDVRDDDAPAEPEPAYFPSTDPVIAANAQGNIDVLGGFAASSDDELGVRRSAEDARPGDEALAEAIQRELREDALTTDLSIDVEVREGVARLRGRVPDLTDAENAEEVANRVPGVHAVIDDLEMPQP